MIALRTFRDLPEAELTSAALASAGIPSFLANVHLVGVAWTYSQAVGGVRLEVFDVDAQDADALLRLSGRWRPAGAPELRGRRSDRALPCAACPPDEVMLEYGSRKTLALLQVIHVPLFFWRTKACCRVCGACRRLPVRLRPEVALAWGTAAVAFWVLSFCAIFAVGWILSLTEKVR